MNNSMPYGSSRLLFDLQATQSLESGDRGVGRYSTNLFNAIHNLNEVYDIYGVFNADLKKDHFKKLDAGKKIYLPTLPTWQSDADYEGGDKDTLNSLAYSAYIGPYKSDLVHISHLFEGFCESIALPHLKYKPAGQVVSATLYDLIPLVLHSHYFQDQQFKKWYLHRLNNLFKVDLLFAISETTRQDAINLLNIDPSKVVTIYGGVAAHFRQLIDKHGAKQRLITKYKLKNKYIFYTGGDDYRKNILSAIKAFAEIPREVRADLQFVIACALEPNRKQYYLNEAGKLGVDLNDIVFTSFIDEEDLVAFYNTCEFFIFPSLYEGLGLPILEAMNCGAAVIGSDNSSIKEIISHQDALFKAENTASITKKMIEMLTQANLTEVLQEHAVKRAKLFSWQQSASLALSAIEEVLAKSRSSGKAAAKFGWLPRKRVAFFSPLPPCRSGIADYNAKFLPYLASYFEIDLYVDNYAVSDPKLNALFRIYNAEDFPLVASQYDAVVYEMGNSEFHAHMLPLLQQYPGIVGLHDAYLSNLFLYLQIHYNQPIVAKEMLCAHGTMARHYFAPSQERADALDESIMDLPCTKTILDASLGTISHSDFNHEVARNFYPNGWPSPYRIVPQMVVNSRPPNQNQATIRKKLNLGMDDFIICTFGYVAGIKCCDCLFEAFIQSDLYCYSNTRLFFVGGVFADETTKQLMETIKRPEFSDKIVITGYLDDADYEEYLQIADLAVQLRINSRGGTPKGVLDCLAHSVPVIVNDAASYKDYPNEVVIKLPAEPAVNELVHLFNDLFANRSKLYQYSQKGLSYLKQAHDPQQCAQAYAAVIHECIDRHYYAQPDKFISLFSPYLSSDEKSRAQNIGQVISWLNQIKTPHFRRRRIFLDVTHSAQLNAENIRPAVKEIVASLYCSPRSDIDPIAVELHGSKLKVAKPWLASKGLLLDCENQSEELDIHLCEGDILLMLDDFSQYGAEFEPIFAQAAQCGVSIYTVIYDLLPILKSSSATEDCTNWLRHAALKSDGIICSSYAVANDMIAWIQDQLFTKSIQVGYWHLGCDSVKNLTWNESANMLLDVILKNNWVGDNDGFVYKD